MPNKTINNIRFAHWEKASLSLSFSRYCKRYVYMEIPINMKIVTILSVLVLSGCASATKTYAPDGREAYSLDCSGTSRNWGMCYEKAGEICKAKGYDTITVNGEQGVATGGHATTKSASVYGSSLHFRTMTIACKK
jgi:hypothetical protein